MQKLRKLLDSNAFVRATRNKKEEKEDCNTSTSVTITPVAGSHATTLLRRKQLFSASVHGLLMHDATPRQAGDSADSR